MGEAFLKGRKPYLGASAKLLGEDTEGGVGRVKREKMLQCPDVLGTLGAAGPGSHADCGPAASILRRAGRVRRSLLWSRELNWETQLPACK